MQEFVPLLWIIAIALVFWLLIIRPAQRRQKDIARLQSSLQPGDQVVLTSGVFGTITEIADTHLVVEIAPGVAIKVVRAGVGSVVREQAPASDESTDEPTAEER